MRSLSARRAWIEIGASHNFCIFLSVALRKESVDRNSTTRIGKKVENTSLSARRAWIEIRLIRIDTGSKGSLSARRAWIEMSSPWNDHRAITSLSARRAWIEIILIIIMLKRLCVALRKESVDRNINNPQIDKHDGMSLSARRAWIEMQVFQRIAKPFRVALRKESVDRNTQRRDFKALGLRRSPQGESG